MRRGSRQRIARLRATIDALPARTREAMLAGVRSDPIIVGAYTDGDGGVCPMLAAHRRGGRTDFASFARAWDRFAGARAHRARRATERELRILAEQLEGSLASWDGDPGFATALRRHRELAAARSQRERPLRVPTGDPPSDAAPAEPVARGAPVRAIRRAARTSPRGPRTPARA